MAFHRLPWCRTAVWRAVAQKRVCSPRHQYSPQMETERVHCCFDYNEIPKGWPVRYVVRPCTAFGIKGNPICLLDNKGLGQ